MKPQINADGHGFLFTTKPNGKDRVGQDNRIKADFVELRKTLNVAKKKRVEYSFACLACFVVERNVRELRTLINHQ